MSAKKDDEVFKNIIQSIVDKISTDADMDTDNTDFNMDYIIERVKEDTKLAHGLRDDLCVLLSEKYVKLSKVAMLLVLVKAANVVRLSMEMPQEIFMELIKDCPNTDYNEPGKDNDGDSKDAPIPAPSNDEIH